MPADLFGLAGLRPSQDFQEIDRLRSMGRARGRTMSVDAAQEAVHAARGDVDEAVRTRDVAREKLAAARERVPDATAALDAAVERLVTEDDAAALKSYRSAVEAEATAKVAADALDRSMPKWDEAVRAAARKVLEAEAAIDIAKLADEARQALPLELRRREIVAQVEALKSAERDLANEISSKAEPAIARRVAMLNPETIERSSVPGNMGPIALTENSVYREFCEALLVALEALPTPSAPSPVDAIDAAADTAAAAQ